LLLFNVILLALFYMTPAATVYSCLRPISETSEYDQQGCGFEYFCTVQNQLKTYSVQHGLRRIGS